MTDLLTDIRIEERPTRPAVSIPIEATLRQWGAVNALVGELTGWIDQRGAHRIGPPYYQHHRVGGMDEPFRVSVGFELAEQAGGDDRVQVTPIPAGRYLVGIHAGHPDDISASHQQLRDYAGQHQLSVAPGTGGDDFAGMYETYLSDPDEVPDLADWRTEIAYLIS